MAKRYIVYARVSSDESWEQGYSIEGQLNVCRQYSASIGGDIVNEITDDFTGTRLDRPGLMQLRQELKQNSADGVVVMRSDRLTRILAHSLILREELQGLGKELHFVNRGKSVNTPEGQLIDNIEAVFNQLWRDRIVEDTRRGTITKVTNGKVAGGGKPPYGYTYMDGMLRIVEDEAVVVRMVYDWYVRGKLVVYAITKRLSEMHIPTPFEKYSGYKRTRGGGIWSTITVNRILASETYAGVWHYGKWICDKARQKQRIPVNVPAIVTREVWESAQETKVMNKQMSRRNTKRNYLLRGFVYCGQCGRRMHGNAWKPNDLSTFCYACNRAVNRFSALEGKSCTQKKVHGVKLDKAVWDYLLDIMSDPERFAGVLQVAQQQERNSLEPKRERVAIVKTLISKCETEANRLATAIQEGGLVASILKQRITDVDHQHAELQKELEELQSALEQVRLTDEDISNALAFREMVIVGMLNPTFEDKRKVVELLKVKVVMNGDQATVSCAIPIPPKTFDLHTLCRRSWSR